MTTLYSDYIKHQLMTLKILPLMYFLDISDIMQFLIKCLKLPNNSFNVDNFISFASGNTQLTTSNTLQHNRRKPH